MPTAAEMVEKIDAAIAAKLDGGAVLGYSINGRSTQHMSLTELLSVRRVYQAQIDGGPQTNYAAFEKVDGV